MIWLFIAAAQADCTLITGATVVLPEGPARVDVRFDTERILEIGPGLAPQDCQVEDHSGEILTAGLIDPWTQLGLVEVEMEKRTRDTQGGSPAVQVVDGYNPRSSIVPITRVSGVTSVVTVPTGGRVSGQSAWVDLVVGSQAEAVVDPSVAMHVSLGSDFGASLRELEVWLDDARSYARNKAAYERGEVREYSLPKADLEALLPLLSGEIPMVADASRASDIEALLRFVQEQELRLVLRGGAEAWLLADELAEAQVPVLYDTLVGYSPGDFDSLHTRPDAPALLHAAGVTVLFTTSSSHDVRELTQYAGNAVREGMPHGAALEAITSAPAEVFGLEGYGVIEVGAVPNLVSWSGDPLELSSQVTALWLRGAPTTLDNRHRALLERYRTLPGSPGPALPGP